MAHLRFFMDISPTVTPERTDSTPNQGFFGFVCVYSYRQSGWDFPLKILHWSFWAWRGLSNFLERYSSEMKVSELDDPQATDETGFSAFNTFQSSHNWNHWPWLGVNDYFWRGIKVLKRLIRNASGLSDARMMDALMDLFLGVCPPRFMLLLCSWASTSSHFHVH
jgi:hypothetical protein